MGKITLEVKWIDADENGITLQMGMEGKLKSTNVVGWDSIAETEEEFAFVREIIADEELKQEFLDKLNGK